MSDDNIQRKMDFIVEQQAKFSVDIELLKEAQKNLTSDVQALTIDVQALTGDVRGLKETVSIMQSEMREGFDNLIVANEVTRKLSEEVAQLAIKTSRRVDVLEGKS
jgi:hypothetical protein